MSDFKSNEEFFAAFRDLTARIEQQGHAGAARELRRGFAGLNGLTDGWAMLLESIRKTIAADQGRMEARERTELHKMLKSVTRAVHRR
jgi:hypothetical protein